VRNPRIVEVARHYGLTIATCVPLCFGQTRRVSWQSTISVGGALYSVPHELVDERVWARVEGDQLVVVHADSPEGPREVARHELTTPGRPRIRDEHYPPRPAGALERRRRPQSSEVLAFLELGEGAVEWLTKAAALGATRVSRKMAEAVELAAAAERFGEGDLASNPRPPPPRGGDRAPQPRSEAF
jgi:hypothetical protein